MANLNRPYRIVSTRSLGRAIGQKAAGQGIELIDLDFQEFRYKTTDALPEEASEPKVPLVFTSYHGVKACLQIMEARMLSPIERPAYAVEGRTSRTAASSVFSVIKTADNGRELADAIIDDGPKAVLYACAADRRPELPKRLLKAGIDCVEWVVYEKLPRPHQIQDPDGVIFFSPSQVDVYLGSNRLESEIPAFCIGKTTAGHLQAKGHKNIHIADAHSVTAMMKEVFNYYNATGNV
jgi:uroporphyrinogen-III synthase